jgi:hypothetical protein
MWVALAAVAGLAASAQAGPAPPAAPRPWHAPRTAFGAPDLQGFWTNVSRTGLERRPGAPLTFATRAEEAAFEAAVQADWTKAETAGIGMGVSEWHPELPMARIDGRLRTSWIVSPADGRLPWRPQALARYAALSDAQTNGPSAGPEARTPFDRCLMGGLGSAGPPFINPSVAGGKQIVQTPREVAILSEMNHDLRIVRLGGRHPPRGVRVWMGDSIGHWEGDTLVVETTNFHPQEFNRGSFMFSADAKVTERFTRVSPGELRYVFEVDDPATYAATWRAEMPFVPETSPIYEFACHEGNYSLTGILGAARKAEADAAAAAR